MYLWEQWLLIVPRGHVFTDGLRELPALQSWSRAQLAQALKARLNNSDAPHHAPFWVAFESDKNARNTLIKAGRDPHWPVLTTQAFPVISAFKLLERWRDASLKLWIAPLF